MDFIKTQGQLCRHVNGVKYEWPLPSKLLFRGMSSMIAGNSFKALVRYSTYNSAIKFMADGQQVAAPQVVVAGMMTGKNISMILI